MSHKAEVAAFLRLTRHFLTRLVRAGFTDVEFDLGLGVLLGLLAAPGAFQSFLLLDKYSTLFAWLRGQTNTDFYRASAPDKYLFLALSMGVTGIVTVLKWDRILPDSQDYLNLAPLPIRSHTIFLANASAIAIAVLVLAFDVNAASTVLFPLFVTAAAEAGPMAFFHFAGIHGLCLILSSLFTFCAVFGLLGTLAAVLPRETFRSCSSWLRGAILVAFLMLLLSGFAAPDLIRRIARLGWLPSFWFLGLYQSLQHRATAQFALLADRAVLGCGSAAIWMALSYAVSYRRYAGVLESGSQPARQRVVAAIVALLDLFSPRTAGFPQAGCRFVVRALLRNEAHRFCVSVFLGLGWLLALQSPSPEQGSLIAAFLLLLGLRLAYEIPVAVPANWVFRTMLNAREHSAVTVARRVMLSLLSLGVLVPSFAWVWWRSGLAAAGLHTLYVLALGVCLVEVLLSGYRKIPFTCPTPGFRDNFLLLCLLQFLGFEAYTRLGAATEHWMMAQPIRFLLVPAAMLAARYGNQRRLRDAREAGELQTGLSFNSAPPPVMERLKLFDAE